MSKANVDPRRKASILVSNPSTADSAVTLLDVAPSAALFAIECAAHPRPWSERVFMNNTGRGYRWRALQQAGTPVGFTLCQQVVDELTLHNIAVSPNHQGHGYGQRLLDDVLDYAGQHDLTVFLEVRVSNLPAIRLYTKSGFDTVGRRPDYYLTENGREDGFVMRWQPAGHVI